MSNLQKFSGGEAPREDIIDAEFEEIVADRQSADTKPQRPPDYTISEWLIDMHPAKAAIVVAVLLLVFIGFVQIVSGGGDADNAQQESGAVSAVPGAADQMLAGWSERVTGQPQTKGFNLVDGTGPAGSSCNEHGGSRLLQFGQSDETTPIVSDFFTMQLAGSEIAVGGAFWFDAATSELTIRNAHAVDLKRSKDEAIPDKIFKVSGGGDGTVQLDGVTYHYCVMTQ